MWIIAKRELWFYFSHITGYLVIGSYLTINTLLLWFFDTPYQLLNSGFGDLSPFFEISPLLFLFLIPALGMRSFSEEHANGTIEILITKPLRPWEIFGGKFLGISLILTITILPTTINIFAIQALLEPQSKIDWGVLLSSYMALTLLCMIFLSISIFSSILFRSQVSSFLAACLVCFAQFFLWDFIADSSSIPWLNEFISNLGIQKHYLSLTQGVIKLEDLIYFSGLIVIIFISGIELLKNEQV
tara:strand:+ start:707 stop:1438 length:732 start_codon:yes stop_codon:yes gene_type:complete